VGVRHRLAVILALAVCAVLAGARSFTAIAEWAADTDEATRAGLGIGGAVPCESTIRRTLQRLDADAFDDLAGAWPQQRTAPSAGRRRVVAMDGKTLRGSATPISTASTPARSCSRSGAAARRWQIAGSIGDDGAAGMVPRS